MKTLRGLMNLTRYGLWLLAFMLVAMAALAALLPSYPSQAKYVLNPITVNIKLESYQTVALTAIGPISGTSQVGQTLTAGALTPSSATASYQWLRCTTSNGDFEPISGATASTYKLTAGDYAYYIKVQATGTGIYTGAVTSGFVGSVDPKPISMATIEGVTVPVTGATAVTSLPGTDQYSATISWSPAHSTFQPNTTYTADITVTPKTGYTLTGVPADFFKVAGASTTNQLDSGSVTAVFPPTSKIPLISVAVNGTAQVGQTLTAVLIPSDATVTYQWERNGTVISGATSNTYILSSTDVDQYIKVQATGTGNYSGSESASVGPVTLKPISIKAISVVTVPTAGGLDSSSITPNVEYSGTIVWNPALIDGKFAGDTVYIATITITPNTGYTLNGVTVDSFTVAGATSATNDPNSGVVTATFPKTAIPLTAIGNITGTTQVGYTLTAGAVTPAGATFTYQWLRNGGQISEATANTYTLTVADAGQNISVTAIGNGNNSGTVTSASVGPVSQMISIKAISGVTVPTAGMPGSSNITANAEYSGTIVWSPTLVSGNFASNTVYTATITISITPNTSYTLNGVSANFFTVAGATPPVTNATNSGVITAVFPTTGTISLTSVAINGTLQVGQTLTANIAPSGATATYQWQTGPSASGPFTDISGATSYVLTSTDFNKYIKVVATGTGSYSGTVSASVGPITSTTAIFTTQTDIGVPQPKKGDTAIKIITTTKYTAEIIWDPSLPGSDKFQSKTIYKAEIKITPMPGYTVIGVPTNYFVVNGADTINSITIDTNNNTATVVATYPETAKN